jgi:hypothetical protein
MSVCFDFNKQKESKIIYFGTICSTFAPGKRKANGVKFATALQNC